MNILDLMTLELDAFNPYTLINVDIGGVQWTDYPMFTEANVLYAEASDGRPLTDDELTLLVEKYPDFAREMACEQIPF